ncbi:MAG: TIGR02281 family clan AA aspartic protease [Betaproteobacteria bacterium]|nr:TIGR02281 family clan AA aspartic protease [Betaproteobacteria bacterium]
MRHCNHALLCCLLTSAGLSHAVKVTVVGLFPGKAVVVIDAQDPRTLSVGQKTPEGVMLISTASDSAMFEIDGKKQKLELGQLFVPATNKDAATTAVAADGQGHHWVNGQINGKIIRMLIDTGATSVSLPAAFARSAGIDYLKGVRGMVQTANGTAAAWRVKVDSISVGDITLYQVDAVVMEAGLDTALLGMSFLNRTDMKRDGANLVLTKRF